MPLEPLVGAVWSVAAVACVEVVLLAVVLLSAMARLRRTTLLAPIVWALVSLLIIATVECVAALQSEPVPETWLSVLLFAAASSSLCPVMAVLGAKRPQHRAWQWVVLTLWLIVLLPALQQMLIPTGPAVTLFALWRVFLGGLICLTLLNYLPTRFWLAAIFSAVGQMLLMVEFLLPDAPFAGRWMVPAGLGFQLAAAAVVLLKAAPSNGSDASSQSGFPASDVTRRVTSRWLSFRDAYGAFWALRIMQRVNQTAEICAWPVRLEWSGLVPYPAATIDTLSDELEQELGKTFDTLMRRFEAQ